MYLASISSLKPDVICIFKHNQWKILFLDHKYETCLPTSDCSEGTYGRDCVSLCGKCRNGASCDPVSAECPGECDDGYLGNKCQDCE